MAAPTIDESCDALASVLSSFGGLRALGYADDTIMPPQAQVFTREFDPWCEAAMNSIQVSKASSSPSVSTGVNSMLCHPSSQAMQSIS